MQTIMRSPTHSITENQTTCCVSRFRTGVVVGERQLSLVVLNVSMVVMVEVMGNSVLHRRGGVPAPQAREGVTCRQGAHLLAAAVSGTHDVS